MSNTYILYTNNLKFIGEVHAYDVPEDFTGIAECNSNQRRWYLNGKLHREDGPAVEHFDGSKGWYINGKNHRLDGPATIWSACIYHSKGCPKRCRARFVWRVDGKIVTELECKLLHSIMKLKGLI